MPLNPLRAFAVASRHRTFTAAANQMGVTQVAISRQVAILEAYLGVKLFERSSHSVKLTEAGRAFGQQIAGLFDEIEHATLRMLSNENESVINVRVYPTFARHWLMPRLPEFLALHPTYRVRLDTTVEPLDFRGTHLDLAIQLGHGDWRDAQCRKLFDEVVDVVCSPAYAARLATMEGEGGAAAVVLHAKYRRREWDLWTAAVGRSFDFGNSMDFDTSLLTYSAAENGLGLAIGQLALLQDEFARGTLVRPFDAAVATGMAFHVVWPTMQSVSTQTRRFADWLLACAGEAPEFFRKRAR